MIQRLIELGLSNYEASAYLSLLKQGSAAPVAVAEDAGIPLHAIYEVLASLSTKGFCSSKQGSQRVYVASHPGLALTRLRQTQAEEFRRQENYRIAEAKVLLRELEPMFNFRKEQSADLPSVELVRDEAIAVGRFRELLHACAKSVCFTVKIGSHAGTIFDPAKLQETISSKGLTCRAIVENPALADPTIEAWLSELADIGVSVRTVQHLPVQLSVFDSTHSMLSVPERQIDEQPSTSLVIQHVPTAEFIRFGFDKMWAEGSSLDQSNKQKSQD